MQCLHSCMAVYVLKKHTRAYVIQSTCLTHAGTGQAVVAAGVAKQLLKESPQRHVIYLTDRVHLLYQQAAAFTAQLEFPVGR